MANHPNNNSMNSFNNNSNTSRRLLTELLMEELTDDGDEQMFRILMERTIRERATIITREPIIRDRQGGHDRIFADYFSDNPVYPLHVFRQRFRMHRVLFNHIVESLSQRYRYFQLRYDATKVRGHSPIQKCTAAIRQLAYGNPPDSYDEYIRIGETTAKECLFYFCRGIIEIFGPQYLRRPNEEDVERLLQIHGEHHGFPGMLGSLDCMHWTWRACSVAWHGQYTRGDHGVPTIMLEAVSSQDLWIWHAFFGVAESNNDINVLRQSPLFNDIVQGFAPEVRFSVNGTEYTKGYYLVDGIYPEWATFVKSFPSPIDPKRLLFKKMQESARKDVECAFGVLQARWAIILNAARFWDRAHLKDIMYACIILHNMIVENEGEQITNWESDVETSPISTNEGLLGEFQASLHRRAEIRDRDIHNQLKADLVEHIWQRFGGSVEIN